MADLILKARQTLAYIEKQITKYDKEEIINADFPEENVLQLEICINENKLQIYYININEDKEEIWISSPVSGPTHFYYSNNNWINRKDNVSLFNLLYKELKEIIPKIELKNCLN